MTEDNENLIDVISTGGLPQILLGPAGAAISRLIGAAVEIPATWLDGHAETLRNRATAKAIISKKIAESVGDKAASDPEVLERALNSFLSREYRFQENKDAVAAVAVDDLIEDPPPNESVGPTEQFMENFEKYAERAVSDDLRTMFGRLLAGEVRQPESVSAATLNFVSLLDQRTAKLISEVIPYCLRDVAILEAIVPRLNVARITELEQIGFWSAEKSLPVEFDEAGQLIKLTRKAHGFVARGNPGKSGRMDIAILSRPAIDLITSSDIGFNYQALADVILKKGATSFHSGPATFKNADVTIRLENEHTLSCG